MNISIETLIVVAIRNSTNVFQGMWTVSSESVDDNQYFFYRCEADESFESPAELEITELYIFGPSGLTSTNNKLTQADALYLLKYALFETILLMDSGSKKKPLFSTDHDLGDLVERLVPEFNKEQLLSLPDEIGFAASIDFKPDDEIGVNAARSLVNRPNLQ